MLYHLLVSKSGYKIKPKLQSRYLHDYK